ncbi:phenylalanine--tRNA ligase subunit beta [Bengtsoniella intestinalis]|uniref:phenylalanine--tRNA ligase subunit beta n=1 Tax=Bengtsoniella intestinalis TaxID=3073143 RepID=UPI00391F151D
MQLSRNWLKEFVSVDADTRTFAEAMTLSGSKVEATEVLGHDIKNIVVGRIDSIVPHPDSDHMVICQMDVGQAELIQIVTGAPNVQVGDYVPTALDDSYLPGGVHITAGKLRGETSNGMLCSCKELGLTAEHDFPYTIEDGICILSADPDLADKLVCGTDIRTVMGLDDEVVEFEITPNRPDCLSVIGLAREAAVTFRKDLSLVTPEVEGCGGSVAEHLDIEIEDGELCPRYTARMVKNVKIAPSPLWMRKRLRASGVRPINNIVDITNYVMLEYGQPMHAFDFSCVEGGTIIVRNARDGETIETLDGTVRELTPSMLCICDENRPVCVAGVMGGANSEIVGDTAMVLFESANFNGPSVRRTAVALNMRTDASARYEKGLDPMNTMKAVERACQLVELLGCGEVIDGTMDVIAKDSWRTSLELQPARINNLLGTDVATADMIDILKPLGFTMDGETVTVPSWRSDVEHYSDLAEEVARFVGYNTIPATLMRGDTVQGGYTPVQLAENSLGNTCRALGYDEIITYSFISPSYYNKINLSADSALRQSITILNPLGEDTSIMRTTTLPSMLEILSRNFNYRNPNARLYELGRTYFAREDGLADEPKVLSLGAYGGMDFFTMKGAVDAVLADLRITTARYVAQKENPSYHPGRCADIFVGDVFVGTVGQIHPSVAANYDVDAELYCAELKFDVLYANQGAFPVYQPLPKFPAVTRDIAVLCDRTLPVGDLMDCIRDGSKGLLKNVALFDVYMGAGVAEDKKSVAFNLQLRSDDGNLTAAQADEDVKAILILLSERHGAVLR